MGAAVRPQPCNAGMFSGWNSVSVTADDLRTEEKTRAEFEEEGVVPRLRRPSPSSTASDFIFSLVPNPPFKSSVEFGMQDESYVAVQP